MPYRFLIKYLLNKYPDKRVKLFSYYHKGLCCINHDSKVIFLTIPKNASSTIKKIFNMNEYFLYHKLDKEIRENYRMFTVLRKPLDRTISAYCELQKNRDDLRMTRKFKKMPESKEKFKYYIKMINKKYFDIHTQSQLWFLYDKKNNPYNIDYALFTETLEEDFDKMEEKLRLNIKFTKELVNTSSKIKKNNVYNYLDDKIKDKIFNIYQQDFELYDKILNSNQSNNIYK